MKERTKGMLTGVLATGLIFGITTTTLAATGRLTITVDPINIQVNGQTFQPKDANGADVPVFAYNGTTYAPLRALAEAYGLEVGYDAEANMATVTGDVAAPGATTTPAPDTTASVADYSDWTAEEEAAYQEFKGMWEIEEDYYLTATYNGNLSEIDFKTWWNGLTKESKSQYEAFCCRMVVEHNTNIDKGIIMRFYYKDIYLTQSSVYANGKTHCFLGGID